MHKMNFLEENFVCFWGVRTTERAKTSFFGQKSTKKFKKMTFFARKNGLKLLTF